jgi:hypothetical protein
MLMDNLREAVVDYHAALTKFASYPGSYSVMYDDRARELHKLMDEAKEKIINIIEQEKEPMIDGRELYNKVYGYLNWDEEAKSCAETLLENGCDPEPAKIMDNLEKARNEMFDAAGIAIKKMQE